MEVNRYPRKERVGKDGRSPIRLMVHYHNKRLAIPTGEKVSMEGWDPARQEVKNRHPWASLINQKLANMEKTLRFVYQVSEKERRPLNNESFKEIFDQVFDRVLATGASSTDDDFTKVQLQQAYESYLADLHKVTIPENSFFEWFQQWLDWKRTHIDQKTGKQLSPSTVDNFYFSMRRYQLFEEHRGVPITFEAIDQAFYEEFKNYVLVKIGAALNTFGKLINHLKQFLGWCIDQNVPVSPKFLKFFAPSKYVGVDFLYQEELDAIKGINYRNKAIQDRLFEIYNDKIKEDGYTLFTWEKFLSQAELARDIFLMCCYTSLRISDAIALEKTSIRGEIIVVKSMIKTSMPCYIPFFDDEIFEPVSIVKKYQGESSRVFPKMATSSMNFHLKIIQRLVGIDRLVLSTKIGRKTFTTLKIYQGVPRNIVMQATGHLTEASFNRYLGVNEKELVEIFKKQSRPLRVVAS